MHTHNGFATWPDLSYDRVLYLARRECGKKICRENGIEYARRLLGHANISTAQRYVHLEGRDLAEEQDRVKAVQ